MWAVLIAMFIRDDSIEDLNPYIEKQAKHYGIL